jgi:hypothetical protein
VPGRAKFGYRGWPAVPFVRDFRTVVDGGLIGAGLIRLPLAMMRTDELLSSPPYAFPKASPRAGAGMARVRA